MNQLIDSVRGLTMHRYHYSSCVDATFSKVMLLIVRRELVNYGQAERTEHNA